MTPNEIMEAVENLTPGERTEFVELLTGKYCPYCGAETNRSYCWCQYESPPENYG